MNATQHFQARSQQRCIGSDMVNLILGLGSCNAKGDLVLLGRKEIDRAIQHLNQIRQHLEKMRSHGGAGIACDGETLITAFHRNRKFKRN